MRRIACESCPARTGSLVCALPAEVLADFRAAGTAMVYRPRQLLFSADSPAAALHLICHGTVKIYHSDRFGRDHIVEVAGPGALLGELSIEDDGLMSVAAEALTDVQAVCLPRERLAQFVQHHPETAIRFLAALSRELAIARHQVRELALKSAQSRLAGLLLQLATPQGGDVPDGARLRLPYTRRELGELVGVSTETAIRLLAALKRKGAIRTDKRDVVLVDAARLRRLAE